MNERVLIVDDQPDIRMLASMLLRMEGLHPVEAPDGPHALEKMAQEDQPFDAVLLDIQMPEMDGWEVLERIRREPRTASLPVLVCTVKGRPEEVLRAWEMGCDGYLTKPFETKTLARTIREILARSDDERRRARDQGIAEARDLIARMT